MKLVIHFGLHKTGSTSFQNFLYLNREALLKAGVLYPQIENDASHFEIPGQILKNDWGFVRLFLNKALDSTKNHKVNSVFISSEDFETILIESSLGYKFEELAFKLGFSEIQWIGVLRSQWDYFNSLYSQLSHDGAVLNYSALGHDIIHFGHSSIGTGTFRWKFAFDYDFFINRFIENISGSLYVISFEKFIESEIIGKDLINNIIGDSSLKKSFWDSKIIRTGRENYRIDKETVEINYLANFLGVKISADFYTENEKIFAPLVAYRQSLISSAEQDLYLKFLERFPKISNRI